VLDELRSTTRARARPGEKHTLDGALSLVGHAAKIPCARPRGRLGIGLGFRPCRAHAQTC